LCSGSAPIILIDEVLKFMERAFFMEKADNRAIREKAE